MHRTEFLVIGGSYAGLSAALQLARARRDVTVVDAGARRNRFVDAAGETSHGYLSQDGVAPAVIAANARQQLLRYPTVRWLDGTAEAARHLDDGRFQFSVAAQQVEAARVVLALGVRDELPPVPGMAERWGQSIFHCPYCHGYELDAGPIGIIATSALAQHHAVMLPDWGRPTLFLNGAYQPSEEELALFRQRGTTVEVTPVARIDGVADVVLTDGRTVRLNGLFTQPRTHLASPLAEELGCELVDGPMGAFIKVDGIQQTTVANVFACGDAARAAGNVVLAAADGAMAGISAHRAAMQIAH